LTLPCSEEPSETRTAASWGWFLFFSGAPPPIHHIPDDSLPALKAADGEKDLLEIRFSLRLVLALEGVESLMKWWTIGPARKPTIRCTSPENAENVWKNLTTTT
jgi:hypothetical protein